MEASMTEPKSAANENKISRDRLAELLNEDLSREYQAIIAYVVYSQVLTGAQYMDIAAQLEIHAKQELDHALIISRQIDYQKRNHPQLPRSHPAMRSAGRIRDGGTDSPDPHAGAGPSNRSSHCPRHRSSGRQQWPQRTHPAQTSLTLILPVYDPASPSVACSSSLARNSHWNAMPCFAKNSAAPSSRSTIASTSSIFAPASCAALIARMADSPVVVTSSRMATRFPFRSSCFTPSMSFWLP